eukprot:jgi/Chrzof1/11762/Cz06g09020.t1
MVSLRDGKTYVPGKAPAAEPKRATGRGNRRVSAVAQEADAAPRQQRQGSRRAIATKQEAADGAGLDDSHQILASPVTPAAPKSRIKRSRQITEVEGGTDSKAAGQLLEEAMNTPLPDPSPSPSLRSWTKHDQSPGPKKKPKTDDFTFPTVSPKRSQRNVVIPFVVALLAASCAFISVTYSQPQVQTSLRHSLQELGSAISHNFPACAAATQQLQTHAAAACAQARSTATWARQWASDSFHDMQSTLMSGFAAVRSQFKLAVKYRSLGLDTFVSKQSSAWAPDHLAQWTALLPNGSMWQELAADISETLCQDAKQRKKGVGLLLGCGSALDCQTAVKQLSSLPYEGPKCTLQLDGPTLSATASAAHEHAAGEVQAAVAPFLQRCPHGLVVVQDIAALPLGGFKALNNALSELGGFQHGGKVDSTQAAFVLLQQLPQDRVAVVSSLDDTSAAATQLKDNFFSVLQQKVNQGNCEDGTEQADEAVFYPLLKALRRRIEFAAPVRLSSSVGV